MALVILDRDGVINFDSEHFIKSPDEWRPIPGSLEAIARLCRANFRVVIATNQSGIGRGLFGVETLNQIHKKMIAQVQEKGGKIDAIFFCPHTPEDHCNCRKPKPGMIKNFMKDNGLTSLSDESIFIGDKESDVGIGLSMRLRTFQLDTGKYNVHEKAEHVVKKLTDVIPLLK